MNLLENKILGDSQVKIFVDEKNYVSAAEYLFKSQLNGWELMRKNYESLKTVQTKSYWFGGFKIKIQFNPERIKSTSAEVDDKSIKNRKCFLCAENLPNEQKGILLSDKFLLLCNPYPIFPQHFTICLVEHKHQRIIDYFQEFLEIAAQLSGKYTLVYNGPECGASAPDHLHFQAGTKLLMPIENDFQQLKNDYGEVVEANDNLNLTFIDDEIRKYILIESADKSMIGKLFLKIYKAYSRVSKFISEPLMNILCDYDKDIGWRVIVFLRSKHRPVCFYLDNPEKILVSPATVDLGGLLITPRKEDFDRMDKELVKNILNEVSLDREVFRLFRKKFEKESD